MDNYLLMEENKELEELSSALGFSKTYFINQDFIIIKGENKKEILSEIHQAKGKITIFETSSEEMLRFVLEKTPVKIIMGMEKIHKKDSLHYIRGGLDQVSCKIAAEKGKIFGFSLAEIMKNAGILNRIIFNISLCQKYGVKTVFSNFSSHKNEMRSARDLTAFWEALSSKKSKLYI